MRISNNAAPAALLVFAFASSASAETIGQMPINYSKIKVADYEGNDFTLLDRSTNLEWKFPSGDQQFYELLGKLNGAAPGNLASFAYVGNGIGDTTDHAAWLAPMDAEGQPSAHPGKISARGARAFNPQTLSITKSERGTALTDGQATIAEVRNTDDEGSLQLLRQMVQTHQLNVAWQIPSAYERSITPVGASGPVVVFLKADAAPRPQARAKDPVGIVGAVDHLAETPAHSPSSQSRPEPAPTPVSMPLVRAEPRQAARSLAAMPPPKAQAPSTTQPEVQVPEEEEISPVTTPSAEEEAATCHWWSPRCWSLKAKAGKTPTAVRQN